MGAPMRSVIPGGEGELAAAGVGPVPGGRDGPPAGACSSDAGPVMPENAEIHLKKSMANTQKKSEGSPSTLFSEDASKPVSRVLSFKTAIYLDAPLPVRSSRLPGTVGPTCVSLHGVAPDRVYIVKPVFPQAGWALTPPFHPYFKRKRIFVKRFFSVTLLCPHEHLPVKKHDALCCPDFPLSPKGQR